MIFLLSEWWIKYLYLHNKLQNLCDLYRYTVQIMPVKTFEVLMFTLHSATIDMIQGLITLDLILSARPLLFAYRSLSKHIISRLNLQSTACPSTQSTVRIKLYLCSVFFLVFHRSQWNSLFVSAGSLCFLRACCCCCCSSCVSVVIDGCWQDFPR